MAKGESKPLVTRLALASFGLVPLLWLCSFLVGMFLHPTESGLAGSLLLPIAGCAVGGLITMFGLVHAVGIFDAGYYSHRRGIAGGCCFIGLCVIALSLILCYFANSQGHLLTWVIVLGFTVLLFPLSVVCIFLMFTGGRFTMRPGEAAAVRALT